MQRRYHPVLIVAALAALAAVATADAPRTPPAAARPVARSVLVVELEWFADGTSRTVSSQVIRTSADAVALARRLAAAEVDSAAGQPGNPSAASRPAQASPAAGEKPPYVGQCRAIATSSGKQCRKRALPGAERCELHASRE